MDSPDRSKAEQAEHASTQSVADTLSEADVAKLMRKVDFHVLPILFLIYIASFLDRSNISNALTMGLPQELGLTGEQPNTALAVFFVPYIIFEIPSNLLMKRFSPHVWLSLCILGFGIVTLCQAFVQDYGGLLATRFFLGCCETGIAPGSLYLISFWYKRQDAQKRFTVFLCSVIVASAFGGLLASAIAKMDGIRGISDWRWIFILEGILTILIATTSFFFISDFPTEASWLTEEEKAIVLRRTRSSETVSEGKVTGRDLAEFFKDPKNLLAAIMYFCIVTPLYAFAYFTPTIVRTLGYSVIQTQLHSVPPFAAALGMCLVLSYLSDRTDYRLPYLLFSSTLIIPGLAILITTPENFSVQYAGLCLACMGIYSASPLVLCWYLMNLEGHKQRGIGAGWVVGFGNIGGILAPFLFLSKYAPYYHQGYLVCIGLAALGVVADLCYAALVLKERRRSHEDDGTDKMHALSL
ncbi:putative allantoate permease [Hypoxylon sp. FL1857]|nr:putative allantoate permease [Hypoxylon sp. FL1857]